MHSAKVPTGDRKMCLPKICRPDIPLVSGRVTGAG